MSIRREFSLGVSAEQAFDIFVNKLSSWWPAEYTWAQDKLEAIAIEPYEGGRCFEVSEDGFRCDWGTVVKIDPPKQVIFKWQISPQRVPVPDPEKASDVELRFSANGAVTRLEFEHRDFDRHGEGYEDYQTVMDSEQGWDYILGCYSSALAS